MQKIKRDGKKKQVKTDLGIIIAAEMGLLSTLKKIKFNPKPSNTAQNTINPNQTRLVDFHMEISKKIDEVIQKHEQENINEQRIIEPRTTWTKTPKTPLFKTEIQIDTETTSFDNELFEFKIQTNNTGNQSLAPEPHIQNQPVFVGPIQPKNTTIFAVGDHSEDTLLTTLGRIKINKEKIRSANKTKTKKKNGYSKAKDNYQEVQTELEKKKHELEEMKKLAKQKEEELKKKEHERKEKEKQKMLEKKQHEKEEKLRAKQELKIVREKEREKKKQDKIKQLELIKLEKQREKELKQQEKIKEMKSKEIEKQKQKELKEKEELKALKEKQVAEKKKKQQKTTKTKPIIVNFLKKKEKSQEEKIVAKTELKTTKKEIETNIQPPEDDLIKAFEIIDELLGKLPNETIDEFVKSDDFEIYEKVVSRYKKK